MVILDASAVLALLADEPGAEAVEAALAEVASISAVNLAEVVSILSDRGMPTGEIAMAIAALGLGVEPFGEVDAYEAGALRAATKSLGLSLGDRACLALARGSGGRVLTADRSWSNLPAEVRVEVVQIR